MNPVSIISLFLAYANRLRFRNLFLIVITLFVIDLLVPDFIPLVDEILLGLLAVILGNWKKEKALKREGTVIDGEVINDNNS